jgi:hypothetical protein
MKGIITMNDTKSKNGRYLARISKKLARILKWIDQARARDTARPIMEGFHFQDPENGKLGKGIGFASDGFRIHIVQEVNAGDKDPEADRRFYDNLFLPEGHYHAQASIPIDKHFNEFERYDGNFPSISSIMPSLNPDLKPVAIICINSKFLAQAVKDSKQAIIRVFASQKDLDEGKIWSTIPYEILTADKDTDLHRMAVVMPMQLFGGSSIRSQLEADEGKFWPVSWPGEFPKKESDEEDEAD